MYTEICAELGAAIAVASSAPYIQFSLIFVSPSLEVGRFAFFQHGKDYYSVSISRGKVTGVSDLNTAAQNRSLRRGASAWVGSVSEVEGLEDGKPSSSRLSSTEESKGAKYQGSSADVADRCIKQLLRDIEKLE